MSEREGQEQQITRAQQCVQHIVELISNPYTTEPISPIRWSTIVTPYLRQRGFSPHSLQPLLEASMKSIQTEVENSDAIQRAAMASGVTVAKAIVRSCVGDEAPLSLIDAEVLPDSRSRDYVYTSIASQLVGIRPDVALDAISRANVLIFAHSTSGREQVAYFAESRLKEGNIDEALTVVEKMIAPNSGSNFFVDDAQLGNAQAAVLNTLSHISEAVAETPELHETYGRQLLDQLKTISIRYGNWTKSETEQLENDELGLMDRITLAWNQILGKIAENMKNHGLYKPTPESYIAMGLSIHDPDNEAVAYYRKLSRAIFHFKSVRRFMETTERPTEFRVIRRETGGSHLALFEELPLHDRYSLPLTKETQHEFKWCFKEADRGQVEQLIKQGLMLQLTDW